MKGLKQIARLNGQTMTFLFIDSAEFTALMELPYIQRLLYLMGIRPYMDKATNLVGIKRRISYQSLRETLYVGPIAGVKTGSPSIQQIKRAMKSLERAGLIQLQSNKQELILKCLLANTDNSVQKQAVPRPNRQAGLIDNTSNAVKPGHSNTLPNEAEPSNLVQADIPHNKDLNFLFLNTAFKKFWTLYPVKTGKHKAWDLFQGLNPTDKLMTEILSSLQDQITFTQAQQASGHWVPNWKNPANWLAQQCWKDEINSTPPKEKSNEKHERPSPKKSAYDKIWESCKGGLDFDFDSTETECPTTSTALRV